MAPRPRRWRGPLDLSEGPEYTRVHQPLGSCKPQQGSEHAAVVGDGGGTQVSQRFGQVRIDPFWPKVLGSPRKALGEDGQLLQVSGASANPVHVRGSQVDERHGEYSLMGREWYTRGDSLASGPQNRYILPNGQLAQLVSRPLWEALRITLWVSASILRAALLLFLAVAFLADRMELVLGLLAAGQFAQAITEVMRPRRG